MDVDLSGNLYVIDRGNDRIQKLTAEGLYLAHWPADAEDIAVGPQGDVYTTDDGLGRVFHFDANGNSIGDWGSPDPNDIPRGLGVDAQGNVYVLFNGINGPPSSPVRVYDRFGNFLLAFGTPGSNPGQIKFGIDLSVDAISHHIYVLDSERSAVLKYSPFGSVAIEEASWSAVKRLYTRE
jgi:DNA-binding beta-propeller fold protein YncE